MISGKACQFKCVETLSIPMLGFTIQLFVLILCHHDSTLIPFNALLVTLSTNDGLNFVFSVLVGVTR